MLQAFSSFSKNRSVDPVVVTYFESWGLRSARLWLSEGGSATAISPRVGWAIGWAIGSLIGRLIGPPIGPIRPISGGSGATAPG